MIILVTREQINIFTFILKLKQSPNIMFSIIFDWFIIILSTIYIFIY